jgi:hypothetical protein
LRVTRAAQRHQAGRVFETTALNVTFFISVVEEFRTTSHREEVMKIVMLDDYNYWWPLFHAVTGARVIHGGYVPKIFECEY